ncbi:MAG: 1-acyl-sn-glycerol-3-phosphate acyltransferase [Oscillospiraceae bacterium]|nr:1-acyl-sn-glycerol-3-phosphate acyltransferase [Oscillospiraceae bacterium]
MLLKTITGLSALVSILLYMSLSFSLWLLPAVFAGLWLALALIAFGFLCLVCALVDLDKPQEQDSKFYRIVMYIYIEALVSLVLARIHATGLEKTPKNGRFLLVCNHLFLADPGVLLHCFRKSQLSFITKQENQSMFVVGKIMHKILCQPLDRNNDRQALKVILKCIQMIKEDQASIGVFPEGYTSRDGKLHHFRSGVFKIAQKTNVPIVVCTIQNTREIFKNLKKLKRTHIQLHLVDVIQPEEYTGMTTTEISDKVYELMISDLGEHWRPEE